MDALEAALANVRELNRKHRRALAAVERTRAELHRGMADAMLAGVRPRDLIAETGLTSETVRRVAREQGVPPLREATVVSKRQAESGQS